MAYTGDLKADLLAVVRAHLLTNEEHGDIIPMILIEMPRHPDLRSSIGAPWRNLEGVIGIIGRYQEEGALETESPVDPRASATPGGPAETRE